MFCGSSVYYMVLYNIFCPLIHVQIASLTVSWIAKEVKVKLWLSLQQNMQDLVICSTQLAVLHRSKIFTKKGSQSLRNPKEPDVQKLCSVSWTP